MCHYFPLEENSVNLNEEEEIRRADSDTPDSDTPDSDTPDSDTPDSDTPDNHVLSNKEGRFTIF